jgi:hypothetical protein
MVIEFISNKCKIHLETLIRIGFYLKFRVSVKKKPKYATKSVSLKKIS